MSPAETVAVLRLLAIGSQPAGLAELAARLSRRVTIPCRVTSDGSGLEALPVLAGRDQHRDPDLHVRVRPRTPCRRDEDPSLRSAWH